MTDLSKFAGNIKFSAVKSDYGNCVDLSAGTISDVKQDRVPGKLIGRELQMVRWFLAKIDKHDIPALIAELERASVDIYPPADQFTPLEQSVMLANNAPPLKFNKTHPRVLFKSILRHYREHFLGIGR